MKRFVHGKGRRARCDDWFLRTHVETSADPEVRAWLAERAARLLAVAARVEAEMRLPANATDSEGRPLKGRTRQPPD